MTRTIEMRIADPSRVFMLISLFSLILVLSAPVADAQDTGEDPDPYPLRPADTSSPRDTLRSFLGNTGAAIDEWRSGELGAAGYRAYDRALETLDFSTTPENDARSVQTRRMLLLREILDRVEIPPDNEVPGDDEVADGAITQWAIPDTRITIERIEHGPRAGEFLFSARTVEQLGILYRLAEQLPYKPGVSTGISE